jgi:hypothetical protein
MFLKRAKKNKQPRGGGDLHFHASQKGAMDGAIGLCLVEKNTRRQSLCKSLTARREERAKL